MKNRVIVISADAMVGEDLKLLKTLPNYKKYLAGGAEVGAMKSIYPTVTYPAHVSMSTGVYPDRHGVLGNMEFLPNVQPGDTRGLWNWFHSAVKTDDIFTAAHKAGYTTGNVFWPVTAGHPDIDWNLAEYWRQKWIPGDRDIDAFKRAGASPEVLAEARNMLWGDRPQEHNGCDRFVVRAACAMIIDHKPELLMLHPANIDHARHVSGVFSTEVDQAIHETDIYISEIMSAAASAGIADEVNLILTSDHGQMGITRVARPNVMLKKLGYFDERDGKITDWRAWSVSCGMSTLIYVKDNDAGVTASLGEKLRELCAEGVWGFSRVYTEREAREEERFGGDFAFCLETDGYTSFSDDWDGSYVTGVGGEDYRVGHATHGYLPSKGPQPVFLAKGPAIRENAFVENGRIIDLAPTVAAILGVDMGDVDGKALDVLK